jgi:NADPH2:quinone reductase
MHALTFSRFGEPEVLEWTALPDPQASPGVAVVRAQAIGLNFADIYRRQGRYHLAGSPPWIAGYEAAGEIAALHPHEAGGAFAVGQRVAFADSSFANTERVAVPLDRLIALPDDIDAQAAAAVLLQGLTAQFLVEDSHTVRAGETLLVHAAGGVGQLLVQLANAKGAQVIALASSEDKRGNPRAATCGTC